MIKAFVLYLRAGQELSSALRVHSWEGLQGECTRAERVTVILQSVGSVGSSYPKSRLVA